MLTVLRNLLSPRRFAKQPTRRSPWLELLEDRYTPATITTASVDLPGPEQLMLQMLNQERANPSAAAALYGIDVNSGLAPGTLSTSPLPPLAPTTDLQTVAEQHSADMIANNYFSHTAPDGSTPETRIQATGYDTNFYGENIAYIAATNNTPAEAAPNLQADLFQSHEHRQNILDPDFTEVGIGLANQVLGPQDFQQVDATEDFGARPTLTYMTGVLYNDTAGTGVYGVGEGLAGVTVTATNLGNGQAYATTSASGGGYELALPAGQYSVNLNGVTGTVTIASANVEVDLRTKTLLGATPDSTTVPTPPVVTPPTPTPPAAKVPAGTFPADQVGAFRNGVWILDTTHTEAYNPSDTVDSFGQPGDVPVVGDWNGTGKDEIGVFRAQPNGAGEFILDTNGNGVADAGDTIFTFGLAGDRVVVGDWNGASKDEVGVFRSNANGVGVFSLDTNGDHQFDAGDQVFTFGLATDKIVIGDWNNSGTDKVGVYRDNGAGVGLFSLDTTGDHQFDANSTVFTFGLATDTVVIGDWNGDGRSKVGVVRNDGTGAAIWSLDLNDTLVFNSSDLVFRFGLATDVPVDGKW